MRPSNESLIADYIRDLESEIALNAQEIARGRGDLADYDAKCRAELETLKADGAVLRVSEFGIPYVVRQ